MSRSLDVYLHNFLVGHLSQSREGQLSFIYTKEWLHHKDRMPLSISLPLQAEPFKQKECKGFFSGILPEEAHRSIIANIFGISARNDYSMLEQIGGECAGAVTFVPKKQALPMQDYNYKLLSDDDLAKAFKELPRRPLLVGEPELRLSLAGVQNKLAVYIDDENKIYLPLGNAPSTHILKPTINGITDSVINEAFCLDLARSTGIPTIEGTIGMVNNIEYLQVKRYDRIIGSGYPKRIHQEDFCQALNISPENKYQNEGGVSLWDSFKLIREVSSLPAVDILHLLDTVLFNIIIGNHDAHGKNFSLLFNIINGVHNIRLAPAYDIVCTAYYSEFTDKMAMRVGRQYKSKELTLKDIEDFARDTSLGVAMVRKRFFELVETILDNLTVVKDRCSLEELSLFVTARATRFKNRIM